MQEQRRVPRTWENLPSMVMAPVPPRFAYSDLVRMVTDQAPDKQLVCLVNWGWTSTQQDAARRIELLYEFADDPKLVVMRFLAPVPSEEQVIIRASFMKNTAQQVAASRLFDLMDRLYEIARNYGLHTMTVE